MAANKPAYIWKDRKRFLGLPLSFTRYALTEDRLFLSVGFLSIRDDELLLYRVRDITTTRTLWQRILGVGTLTIVSSDKSQPTLILKNIRNPLRVKELLHTHVETMKLRRRVRIGELVDNGMDDDIADDDLD